MIALLLACMGMFVARGGQDPPRTAEPKGEIRGRVTDKVTGRPLAGAIVSLYREGGPSKTSITSDAGQFRFPALESGRYWGGVMPGPFRGTYLPQPLAHVSEPFIDLVKDEIRQVDVALPSAYTLPVRILDGAGVPLSDIRLSVLKADTGRLANVFIEHTTDDQGRVRLFGLEPGRYLVCAEASMAGGVTNQRLLRTCYPSADDENGAQAVTVDRAEADEIEIRMRRGRTFTISALLLDSAGSPATNARVSLNRYDANSSGGVGMLRQDDGRFRSRNVPPGRYAIEATLGGDEQPQERRPLELAFVPLTVDADIADLTVVLRRTIDVPGRFITDDPSTELPAAQGSGLSVWSRLVGNTLPSAVNGTPGYAAKDRTFTMRELFGRRVLAAENVPRGWYARSIRYNGVDVSGQPIDFDRVREPGQIEVLLSNRGAVLTGRVLDDVGNPVPNATVVVVPVQQRMTLFVPYLPASANGSFRFGPARGGEYAVFALPANRRPPAFEDGERLARLVALGERITLGELDERTLDLHVIKER